MRRWAILLATVVGGRQVAEEHVPAVVVPTDVVHHHEQHAMVGAGPYQGHPHRQLGREVERPAELGSSQSFDPAVAFLSGEIT